MRRTPKRLGFFTRLLDDVTPGERYRLAMDQIIHAEALGFTSAWVAQHHFIAEEGGLPSPFVFLAQLAARTSRIRLGTGVVTLPLEDPVRVAEDAAVLDLLCDGRLEIGLRRENRPPPGGLGRQRAEQRQSPISTCFPSARPHLARHLLGGGRPQGRGGW
jgi:alkanesulfonate monooxygenase SsuD/methylene tetrahydromethanopterin reductase-like flavin-dependent oxidoreductase (luciferase family)